jgi:hypothetical protein
MRIGGADRDAHLPLQLSTQIRFAQVVAGAYLSQNIQKTFSSGSTKEKKTYPAAQVQTPLVHFPFRGSWQSSGQRITEQSSPPQPGLRGY